MAVTPVHRSLQAIADSYSVFEQDQVLTAGQLNSLADYADDQTRLTRVRLLGVGVVCGLRVSLGGGQVRVTRGVGVTSDGDILALDADTTFDRWRPYDASRPAYPPLYPGGDFRQPMIPAFELVRAGEQVRGAQALGTLPSAPGGRALDAMSAVFLMESYVHDEDLCSGTDCDNLGRDALHTPRLLLVATDAAGPFTETVATPAGAFRSLPPVVAARPAIPAAVASASALATHYRPACVTTHNRLVDALGRIWPAAGAFLGGYFAADPARGWTDRLVAIQGQFGGAGAGIQYYYDLLRDVVDTYNDFREHLFGDNTLCAPDVGSFPKHLLLGALVPGTSTADRRTGFYPSPLTGRSSGEIDHAGFLLRKLDAMLARFQIPTGSTVVTRVTPTVGEDRPLEDRAIPYYYQPGTADPIHRRWSYALARRGMEAYSYSYHAGTYQAQGGAASPLGSQIGRFSAFRVEGHLGRPVNLVLPDLETQIRANNLPFTVRAVLLGNNRGNIVVRPPRGISDLHHLHGLVRKDLSLRLSEVESFSDGLTERTNVGVTAGVAGREDPDRLGISVATGALGGSVKQSAEKARVALDLDYATYATDPVSWQGHMGSALEGAATMRSQIGHVARTEFVSPYDTLISSTHAYWLPYIDHTLKTRDEVEDDRLLFRSFAEEHPHLEHTGTVPRGGTLVLAYDQAGTVVADFALPYHIHQAPVEEEPEVETTPTPGFRPPVLIDLPVTIIPSRPVIFEEEWVKHAPDLKVIDDFILTNQGRLDDFINSGQLQIEREIASLSEVINVAIEGQSKVIDAKFAGQDKLIETVGNTQIGVLRDSVEIVKSISTDSVRQFGDSVVGGMIAEADALDFKLKSLEEQFKDPRITEDVRGFIEEQIGVTQEALGASAVRMATYLDKTQAAVGAGTEGDLVVQKVGTAMSRLTGTAALETMRSDLGSIAEGAVNLDLKRSLGGFGF